MLLRLLEGDPTAAVDETVELRARGARFHRTPARLSHRAARAAGPAKAGVSARRSGGWRRRRRCSCWFRLQVQAGVVGALAGEPQRAADRGGPDGGTGPGHPGRRTGPAVLEVDHGGGDRGAVDLPGHGDRAAEQHRGRRGAQGERRGGGDRDGRGVLRRRGRRRRAGPAVAAGEAVGEPVGRRTRGGGAHGRDRRPGGGAPLLLLQGHRPAGPGPAELVGDLRRRGEGAAVRRLGGQRDGEPRGEPRRAASCRCRW